VLRRQRVAQTHAPGPTAAASAAQHVTAAVDQRIADAVRLQGAQSRQQDRQLGHAAEVQSHAGTAQAGGAGLRVDLQRPRIDEGALAAQRGGIGPPRGPGGGPAARHRREVPVGVRAHAGVEASAAQARERHGALQHRQVLGMHRQRRATGLARELAHQARGPEAAEAVGLRVHARPGRLQRGLAARHVGVIDQHGDHGAHQGRPPTPRTR